MMCLFSDIIQKYNNHPVHIIDMEGNLSPSAFIPFCEFGGNMSIMGTRIDQFEVPVCNSFHAKVLNDQLCYEVDLDIFKKNSLANIERNLDLGLAFFMDYNEDRQIELEKDIMIGADLEYFNSEDDEENGHIYLNSIGELCTTFTVFQLLLDTCKIDNVHVQFMVFS